MILSIKNIGFVVALVIYIAASSVALAENTPLTKKQVDSFMKVNRSNLLIRYACNHNDDFSSCHVFCTSGGSEFLSVDKVRSAYYAERLKKLDGTLAGFFLVVDVDDTAEQKDIWATMQTESSCRFEGMTPDL